ncbi:uncharacterized protein LOC107361583 [Tetranychus urticae]|uniref:F-box domain-containing protein n=1 Tax=Tetranychus urticae TaxID=32264 RepID=T1K8C3_TETUR|nr:uncharacterized protein LOC107361583 [Tetranychus urticae]
MNIDELPDDCLLLIFNLFNNFETLLNCSEVCKRWENLVLKRLHSVKYLTNSSERDAYPANYTMFFKEDDPLEKYRISILLPRLRILDIAGRFKLKPWAVFPAKGLQFNSWDEYLEDFTFYIPGIEMIAASHCYNFFANDVQGPKLTQLFISHCDVSQFASIAKYFPNLKRLHIEDLNTCYPDEDKCYTGPVLEKLEILEVSICVEWGDVNRYYGLSLADHCPALKSAYHVIPVDEPYVNSEIENHDLEDLVLLLGCDWSTLRRILSKYPNLKHLAIRGGTLITDENIPELLKILPCIILIDVRDSGSVTEKSTEYIHWYCEHHNRSISLYYKDDETEIKKKWPNLSTQRVHIGRGFDFMKYCFPLKHHENLPYLLDPDE